MEDWGREKKGGVPKEGKCYKCPKCPKGRQVLAHLAGALELSCHKVAMSKAIFHFDKKCSWGPMLHIDTYDNQVNRDFCGVLTRKLGSQCKYQKVFFPLKNKMNRSPGLQGSASQSCWVLACDHSHSPGQLSHKQQRPRGSATGTQTCW